MLPHHCVVLVDLQDTAHGLREVGWERARKQRKARGALSAPEAPGTAGGVAQLGERVNGIHEVRGSIPLASTRLRGGGPVTKLLVRSRE